MDNWSAHHVYRVASDRLGNAAAEDLARYTQRLRRRGLPVVYTLGHLAQITGVRYKTLQESVARRREAANYRLFNIRKRSGGKRSVHAVSRELARVQQFINEEILQRVQPHAASYAFHPSGGVTRCASAHCGARWLFQYDIEDFFFNINEIDVYDVFLGFGYRRLLAFEMARLCTTLRRPDAQWTLKLAPGLAWMEYPPVYNFYANHWLGVLPQGAPSSPMLANLVCRRLDEKLTGLTDKFAMVYTRYGDDIAVSCARALDRRSEVPHVHRRMRECIQSEGFTLNARKTRISGPGARKLVLGLLVDGDSPRLSKYSRHRIERLLHACETYGLVKTAKHEGFDSPTGLHNHLGGLTAYALDVDPSLGARYRSRFALIGE